MTLRHRTADVLAAAGELADRAGDWFADAAELVERTRPLGQAIDRAVTWAPLRGAGRWAGGGPFDCSELLQWTRDRIADRGPIVYDKVGLGDAFGVVKTGGRVYTTTDLLADPTPEDWERRRRIVEAERAAAALIFDRPTPPPA